MKRYIAWKFLDEELGCFDFHSVISKSQNIYIPPNLFRMIMQALFIQHDVESEGFPPIVDVTLCRFNLPLRVSSKNMGWVDVNQDNKKIFLHFL